MLTESIRPLIFTYVHQHNVVRHHKNDTNSLNTSSLIIKYSLASPFLREVYGGGNKSSDSSRGFFTSFSMATWLLSVVCTTVTYVYVERFVCKK